jgi:hypothetical protein
VCVCVCSSVGYGIQKLHRRESFVRAWLVCVRLCLCVLTAPMLTPSAIHRSQQEKT